MSDPAFDTRLEEIRNWRDDRRVLAMIFPQRYLTPVLCGDMRVTNYPHEAILLGVRFDSSFDGFIFQFLHGRFQPTVANGIPLSKLFEFEPRSKLNFELPEWEALNEKLDGTTFNLDDFNPLERFIYNEEPAGGMDVDFRDQLKTAIEFVLKEYKYE